MDADDYRTPVYLFEWLDACHGPFDLDAAANHQNAKCRKYLDRDGLSVDWNCTRAWCNPPYGRGLGAWVKKAWQELEAGHIKHSCCLLLPVRTSSTWFHDIAIKHASHIIFLKGRIKFQGPNTNGTTAAAFDSVVVVLKRHNKKTVPEIRSLRIAEIRE